MANLFAGKYEIIQKLAQGGMAQVYLAKQKGMDGFEKVVVIKRILPHLAESQDFVRMFLDEARTAADLRHANIVNIYEVGEAEGTYFMAMEFLHGKDIRRIQRAAEQTGAGIPIAIGMEILRQAAMGLHYAHSKTDLKGQIQNIVHRDISPHNLIVTFEGTCKVVDFGIAKAESQTQQTASGVLKGKYSYMSPEQASGKNLTAHSDQFALGIVAWEMLLMKRLFRRENEIMTLHAIIANEVPLPTSINTDFPPELESIIMKMLAPNAADRYPSCQDAALAIEDFLISERLAHSSVRVSQYLKELFAEELNQEDETGRIVLGNSSLLSKTDGSLTDFDSPTNSGGSSQSSSQEGFVTRVDSKQGSGLSGTHDRPTDLQPSQDSFNDGEPTLHEDGDSPASAQGELDYTQVTKTHAGPPQSFLTQEPRYEKAASKWNFVLPVLVVGVAVGIGLSHREKPSTSEVPQAVKSVAESKAVGGDKNETLQKVQAYLKVESEPQGATIRFSGKDWGVAPVKIPITPSELPFEVEGYLPEFGLMKTNCFVRPNTAEQKPLCLLKFKKKVAAPKKQKAASAKKQKPVEPKKAEPSPDKRPKLELID